MTTLYPILIISLAGLFAIATFPGNIEKEIGLLTSVITLIESIRLWVSMEEGTSEFQYITKIKLIEGLGLNPILGIDGISILYIVFSAFLIPLCFLVSWDSINIF